MNNGIDSTALELTSEILHSQFETKEREITDPVPPEFGFWLLECRFHRTYGIGFSSPMLALSLPSENAGYVSGVEDDFRPFVVNVV